MKTLCGLWFVIAACGGSSKSAKSPMSGGGGVLSECGKVAAHVADAVFTWKEPPPTTKENVSLVITERCELDQWSVEAKSCFGAISDEESAKPCAEKLTKDQHEKVMNSMEAKFDKAHHAPTSAPPAQATPGEGGPKGADPCEGGE